MENEFLLSEFSKRYVKVGNSTPSALESALKIKTNGYGSAVADGKTSLWRRRLRKNGGASDDEVLEVLREECDEICEYLYDVAGQESFLDVYKRQGLYRPFAITG